MHAAYLAAEYARKLKFLAVKSLDFILLTNQNSRIFKGIGNMPSN